MRIARSAFALFALSAAGCAVDAADPELSLEAPPLSESWTVSTSASVASWDSGLNSNLSDWEYVHCNLDYGDGYMLAGVNVNQENLSDPDDFVARMTGECWEFDLADSTLPKTGSFVSQPIFAATGFRSGVFQLMVADDTYPTGLHLKVNGPGNGTYVKDVRIAYAPLNLNGSALDPSAASDTGWAIGYAGRTETLNCPAQQVMTGLALQYDVIQGEIRKLQIHCRALQP
ncbi:hypothetical protein WMF04_26990 [Sorangium sp. So ce260]|uniref:hypothetical protein n=1 Tax=Sorangium sp. So ce260 TaxID=3133291 RepID=UPI003F5DD41F